MPAKQPDIFTEATAAGWAAIERPERHTARSYAQALTDTATQLAPREEWVTAKSDYRAAINRAANDVRAARQTITEPTMLAAELAAIATQLTDRIGA